MRDVRMSGRAGAKWIAVAAVLLIFGSCVSRVSYRELAQEYYNLGNAFFDIGDFERSYEYYTRALELDDSLPATGYNLARLHVQRGEYKEAEEVIARLIMNDPENSLYRETAAYIRFRAGFIDDARERYRALIDEFPGRSRLYYNLAVLEMGEERPAAAYRILNDGFPFARDDLDYLWLMAEAAYRGENHDEVERLLDRYRTTAQDDETALIQLAERYADWGYGLAALDVIGHLSDDARGRSDLAFLEAGLLLTGTTDFDRGIRRLRDALEGGFEDHDRLLSLLHDVPPGDEPTIRELLDEFEIPLEGPEIDVENTDGEKENESTTDDATS